MKHLRKLEELLLKNEARANHCLLNELLHDSFIEIGYSGKTYNKIDVVNELTNEIEINHVCWSQNYQFITLASDLILILYKEARMDKNGQLSRYSKEHQYGLILVQNGS